MSLPLIHRLQKRRDFQKVYKQGVRQYGSVLRVIALSIAHKENQVPSPTKIGVSISQKVSKKAVIRNRIKRQIKAAIRELLPDIANDWLIVVVVLPEAINCKYEHFLQELKKLLIKIGIINGY